ncbi:hypothetical protein MMC06_004519 [Schaereria dolodes]|nr:hypothetical protein [Schaereria dolodes]
MAFLNAYVVTFNCGRELVKPDVFARHIVEALQGLETPEILLLSLQEVAPIAYSFLGGSYLVPYFNALRHAVDLASSSWGESKFKGIMTRNVGMTAIMAFIREDCLNQIQWLETAGVGVGMHEMGNKGAVGLRLGYAVSDGTMEITFVAAHLAPMEDGLTRRNADWRSIVKGLVFTPVKARSTRKNKKMRTIGAQTDDGAPLLSETQKHEADLRSQMYTPTSHLIFAGDLNYRTSSIKPSKEDYEAYPQPTKDKTDPKHFSNLLQNDQLTSELRAQRTCHGLQEAPIDFPPTYKYSDKQRAVAESNEGNSWDWARHRWPSWCDRILYLEIPSWMKSKDSSERIEIQRYTALPLMSTSDHRPVVLSFSLPLKPIPPPDDEIGEGDVRVDPPFSIDPQWKEKRSMARRKEILVGLSAYFGLTWEGNGILAAILVGAFGGWIVVRSVLA